MNTTYIKMITLFGVITTFSGVYADMEPSMRSMTPCSLPSSTSASTGTSDCGLRNNHEIFQHDRDDRMSEIKKNRLTASGNLATFRLNQSGALKEWKKSNSGSNEALKDAIEHQKELQKSMSGKTLEERLAARNTLEEAQKATLIAKFQSNSGVLAKRLEVYEKNKVLRDENAAKLLSNLLEKSKLRVADIDNFINKVHEKLSTMSQETRAKLITKIAEKIKKIQSTKGITQVIKDELIKKLNSLSSEINALTGK